MEEVPKPNCGYIVYKRRVKISEQTEKESVLVIGTPVKLQKIKVYSRRNSIKTSSAFETKNKQEASHVFSTKESILEKCDCFKVTDFEGNVSVPLDTISSSVKHHNGDYQKDKNACTDSMGDDIVGSFVEKSNKVFNDSGTMSPDSLGAIMLAPQDIDGPVLEHPLEFKEETEAYACEKSLDKGPVLEHPLEETEVYACEKSSDKGPVLEHPLEETEVYACEKSSDKGPVLEHPLDFKEETEAYACEKSSDKGPVLEHPLEETEVYACEKSSDKGRDEDSSFLINQESVEVFNPAIQGSKVEHFDMSSSSFVNNDKQELEENNFFPGDCGFLLLQKRENQYAKGLESSVKEGYHSNTSRFYGLKEEDRPREKEDSQDVGGNGNTKGSRKAPRTRKKSHRPKIMVNGKTSRKTANLRNKTVSKKRKENKAEVGFEPETPGKQKSSKRRKTEVKSKRKSVIEPRTPISLEGGLGLKRVDEFANVARALIFELEIQPREDNLCTPSACVDKHDDSNSNDIATRSYAAESVIPPDSDLVRDPSFVSVREVLENKLGDQKYHVIESMRLSCLSEYLDFTKNLGLKFPELNKRRRIDRKRRADFRNLVFDISSGVLKAKSRICKRKRNMRPAKRLLEITWKKRSKRSARVRNMSTWSKVSLCNRLPKRCSALLKKSRAKGVQKLTCLAQKVQNNKAKEPILLRYNGNQSLGVDSRPEKTSKMPEQMAWPRNLTQNEEARALLAQIPLQLQETRFLYDNYLRSFNYVPPLPDTRLLDSGAKITKDIELLIQKMTCLDIHERALDLSITMKTKRKPGRKKGKGLNYGKQLILLNHTAQGPNALVPYEEQVKQKASAKVQLDPETLKEWQLLMMNDLPGGPNEEREKNWEAEREFFRGRVDLFIKRMHLLQADRKFKQWKGSVVDSVIGVYLTQNVSDHLSSNAFISLAATFPIETTETGNESVNDETDQCKTVVNSECLTYFVDEPLEGKGGKALEVQVPPKGTQKKNKKTGVMEDEEVDWKRIRSMYTKDGPRDRNQMDSAAWDAVRISDEGTVARAIKDRGQQTVIAGRIKDFLNHEVKENGTIDLEWLRDAPSDLVKRYLLEIKGLGLKSVECIRLLALQHIAFPVDTNVGRIAVRLGWVPLEPLPDEVQMHLLDQYPYMDAIQKYLWPRLCRLSQTTLYELHYQMITFGKVFCTKKSPNCNACPMKAECKHFASAYASSQLHLPGLQKKKTEQSNNSLVPANPPIIANQTIQITPIEDYTSPVYGNQTNSSEPIIEMPPSPIPETEPIVEMPLSPIPGTELIDIEDTPCRTMYQPNGEIPEIDLDMETFKKNVYDAMVNIRKMLNSHNDEEVSKALVALTPENACIPMPTPRLKYYSRLRTEHVVYVLPDDHELLKGFEKREADDPSPYLLTVWQPGEKSHSFTSPTKKCNSNGSELCNDQSCSYCCGIHEENSRTIRGTILIPCRTAMRGSFPLNGTYFQINEVFADQLTSLEPIVFPTEWIHGLKKRALYCGASVSAIFRGLDTRRIQLCFWTGYVCVRGFHREKRIPQELAGRLHTPPNKRGKKFERDNL